MRGRGRGEPFRGRGRYVRGKWRSGFYTKEEARDTCPPPSPAIRKGKFRNLFSSEKEGHDQDKKVHPSPDRRYGHPHRSHSHRSERSASEDRGKDKGRHSRSPSREGKAHSRRTYSKEKSKGKETAKGHELKNSSTEDNTIPKTSKNKTELSDVSVRRGRERSASKSSTATTSRSDKRHSRKKTYRSRSSSSSSSSSSSCSVTSCSCCNSSDNDSSASASSRSTRASSAKERGKKQDSNQSKRIVILSSKERRTVKVTDNKQTEEKEAKIDKDWDLKKLEQEKLARAKNKLQSDVRTGDGEADSSVVPAKKLADSSKEPAKTGMSTDTRKELKKRAPGLAARRLNAMSLKEQNKLIESFWSAKEPEESEKSQEGPPTENNAGSGSGNESLYSNMSAKEESSKRSDSFQEAFTKATETVKDFSAVHKPATHDGDGKHGEKYGYAGKVEATEPRPEVHRFTVQGHTAREYVSHKKGFAMQNERVYSHFQYAGNVEADANKHVSRNVRSNLISIIPDPTAFAAPTHHEKRHPKSTASVQEISAQLSHLPTFEHSEASMTYQEQHTVSKSEAQAVGASSEEQGSNEEQGLLENIPAEQYYENEYYETEPGMEWVEGKKLWSNGVNHEPHFLIDSQPASLGVQKCLLHNGFLFIFFFY